MIDERASVYARHAAEIVGRLEAAASGEELDLDVERPIGLQCSAITAGEPQAMLECGKLAASSRAKSRACDAPAPRAGRACGVRDLLGSHASAGAGASHARDFARLLAASFPHSSMA